MPSTIRKLSVIDSAFLFAETTECPMHVGSLAIFRPAAGYAGDFYTDVRNRMLARLSKAPTLMWKLSPAPFDIDRPSWIEDESFDIDRHLVRGAVPVPSDRDALMRLVGFLHAKLLSRSRPLWEMYVFDGLPGGELAIYQKMHHSLVDGGAAVALAAVLYDLQPTEPIAHVPAFTPPRARADVGARDLGASFLAATNEWIRDSMDSRAIADFRLPRTGGSDLASVYFDAAMHQLEWPVRLAQRGGEFAQALNDLGQAASEPGARSLLNDQLTAPPTPLNVAISSERTFAGTTIVTSRVKAVAKAAGGTINDVVLALSSGMLRRWLRTLGPLPTSPLMAFVPISTRAADGDSNNSVSGMVTSLATTIESPRDRLLSIIKETAVAKTMALPFKNLVPLMTEAPSFGTPIVLQMAATFWGRTRLANILPPGVNVTVSNVLYSRVPFYLDGAKLVNLYPISIPVHGQALNVTVHGYDDHLDFGLIAAADVIPDLQPLLDALQREMKALEGAFC